MRFLVSLFIACLVIIPGARAQHDHAPPAGDYRTASSEDWLADLDALDEAVRTTHPLARDIDTRAAWDAAVTEAREAIPDETAGARLLRFHRLLALFGDGHTNLVPFYMPVGGFAEMLPIGFYAFDEGVFVTRTHDAQAGLAGLRLVAIGDRPVAEVMAKLGELVGADNPQWQINWAPVMLRYRAYLDALDLTSAEGVRLTFAQGDDHRQTVTLGFTTDPETGHTARQAAPPGFSSDRNFDFTWLADERTVLAVYNAVADEDDETVAAFAARLFAFIEAHEAERLILDLRNNGGGNNYLNQPLLHGMISSRVNRPGGIIILTGRATFSAAMNLCTRAERHTQALFAGEATGGAPNHYGDPEFFFLPHTGLPVLLSALYWQDSAPQDPRDAIYPDIVAPERFADWVAGRDAALEAALAFEAGEQEAVPPVARWVRSSQAQPH
jgi:hypothetical protein